ncbi:hypothetical protein SteCoe_30083 [Stentor coeruleus]|uniref:Uncharacterized protein n=1 Tax=Stentor coeruleus TaxID=5963 RepID=A0A1R2B4D2_9CILI|nr:hypothetical protein SteCoe_30083 [Stentor coeruleus]
MSRSDFVQSDLISTLTPNEKSKFIEVLSEFDSQNYSLKNIHNSLIAGETKSLNIEKDSQDYWDGKWVISHSVVLGRQLSRWGCAAASIGNKLYLFGGRGSDNRPKNSFHILNLSTSHLSAFKTTNPPKGREGHSMISYKNLLIIYGGCEGDINENDPFEDIYLVDIENKTWKKPNTTGKKPEAREGHAAGVIKNYMIIYGGSGTKSLLSNIFAFNLTTFEWKELDQQGFHMGPRESMSSVVVNDFMYIFGGNISEHSSENDEYTDDFFSITLKNNTALCKKITCDGVKPPKRLSHSLSNLNNKYLVLFGGESFGKAMNDLWVYFIDKNIWREIRPQNSIPARMAHVCYCYQDSIIVYGGMAKDQSVFSDLGILKFGKCEINMNNGTGVNTKRKFTKILSVTARTVPVITKQEPETAINSCENCGHSSTCCRFLSRFNDMAYPVLNFFPRIHVSTQSVEQMADKFQDPFAAMLRIGQVINSEFLDFNIKGFANMKGNQIVKILASEVQKDQNFNKIVDADNENHVKTMTSMNKPVSLSQVPILEISTKAQFSPDNIARLCSGVSGLSFLPAFFKLSDTAVIVSRTTLYLTIGLMHKTDVYIPLFLAVFDNNGDPLYPNKNLVYSNMVNVYSRSHLTSADIFRHPQGTSIFLYTKQLDFVIGDILYQGNSFCHLISKVKGVKYSVAGNLILKDKQNKEEITNKTLLYKTSNNAFSVLVYYKKKLVYWEFKKGDKGKRAREECVVVKLVEDDCLCKVTGLLAWNDKTWNIFADLYSPMKKRITE